MDNNNEEMRNGNSRSEDSCVEALDDLFGLASEPLKSLREFEYSGQQSRLEGSVEMPSEGDPQRNTHFFVDSRDASHCETSRSGQALAFGDQPEDSEPPRQQKGRKEMKARLKSSHPQPGTRDQEAIESEGQIDYHMKQPDDKTNVLQENSEMRRVRSLPRKISKFVLRQRSFKGAEKVSLPKKIGKLYANYMGNFRCNDAEVEQHSGDIIAGLRQTTKNDYTFEKTVASFLGIQQLDGTPLLPERTHRISSFYRRAMLAIIQQNMRREVVMRHKIEQNKVVYMMQLKVYCLRCRSHWLAQKGTFK